ncbi:MAG TPA: sugar phosphate nucleotidyltransferase [Candidatus Nanopelagicaceae bacterium]|nr:sugar phosphate nucleotidyltransferase [Candidatus Nanopelagicaceae bacterium]
MKAVVMAGGEGSRLRPLTSRRPKPLVPVVGRPCLEHVLRLLRRHGITEVVITLQYLGASIRNYFGDGAELGMHLEYAVEDRPLGTAGSVKNAGPLLDGTFLVISGDSLTDIDLSQALAFHRERSSQATIVLSKVGNPLEYGVVVTGADGRIERFLEKPSWGEVFSDQVNTGIYVIEPEVLDYIPADQSCDWSQDVFPEMLRRQDSLWAVVGRGYWCDIGSIQSYLQANWDALEGRVQCEIAGRRVGDSQWISEGAEVAESAHIEGPVFIGRDAVVGAEAFLNGPVVLDRFAVVSGGSKISSSVIWPQAYLGERSRLRQAVVCSAATIKPDVLLDDGSVIGDDCIIGAGSVVAQGVRIWPGKDIEPGSMVHESVIWAGTWRSALFGSAGLTGLINVQLTPEWCARLGAAWAATHPRGAELAICRDRSPGSRMIKRAMISGMLSAGAAVVDLSELPVPVTCHYTRDSAAVGSVHIVASPLDPRSADIEVLDEQGMALDRRQERKLENTFFREDFRRVVPREISAIAYPEGVQTSYVRAVLARLDLDRVRAAHPRVLIDFGFGSTSMVLPQLLHEAQIQTISLRSGFEEEAFESPVPRDPDEELQQAASITKTVSAAVGARIDPAGQRLYLIDDEGQVFDHRDAICLLAMMSLRAHPGSPVVAPVSAPWMLERVVAEMEGRLLPAKADIASVIRLAARSGATLGADGTGGFVWPAHLAAYDAMFTLLAAIQLMVELGEGLSQLRRQLPVGFHLQRDVACPWEVKGEVMRLMVEAHRQDRVDLTDGLKVRREDGFTLVLPDADAPCYKVISSGADSALAQRSLEDFAAELQATVQGSVGPAAS